MAAAGASVLAAILVVADVQVEIGKTPAAANIFAVVEEPSEARLALSTPAPKPAFPADAPKPNRFAWAPTADATEYHFELFRGETRIFAADTVDPAVAVPARWTFGGRTRTLEPGHYSWYVWPVVSGRAGDAIVEAVLPVPAG